MKTRRSFYALLGLMLVTIVTGMVVTLVRSHFTPTVIASAKADPADHRPPLTGRVVVFLVDSLRYDVAWDPTMFPYLNSIKDEGAYGKAITGEMTMTGISSHIIGSSSTPGLTDVIRNFDMPPVEFQTIFDLIKQRGGKIAVVGDEAWSQMFKTRLDYYYTLASTDPRLPGIWNTDVSDNRFLVRLDPALAPKDVADAFAARKPEIEKELETATGAERVKLHAELAEDYPHGRTQPLLPNGEWDLMVIHLVGLDNISHRLGIKHPDFKDKANRVDAAFRQILAELTPDTTVIFLADHGCTANGRHGSGEEIARATPVFMKGPGIKPGPIEISLYDYAPTIAALLGLPLPPAIEGRVATEALAVDEPAKLDYDRRVVANRRAYLSQWEKVFGAQLDLPSIPDDLTDGQAKALLAKMNAEAHDAAVTGHDGALVLWMLLAFAGALVLVAVARRRDEEVPAAALPLAAAVVAAAMLAIALPHVTGPFVALGLACAASLVVVLASNRPRVRAIPAVALGALLVWEIGTAALFALELPIQTVLNTHLGKGGGLLYYGVFWSLQGIAAAIVYARRSDWLAHARRHPMLAGGLFLMLLASLDGYDAVFRAIAIGAIFCVAAGATRWRKLGAVAFLGLLLAWMFTWDHRFFGLDIRWFNKPILSYANLGLVTFFLWRKQPKGPLAIAGALLALAPFVLRIVDADNLFRALLALNVLYFVAVALSSSDDKGGLAQLAIVSFYLLFCFDREFQVTMLLASIAVMELAFASDRWRRDDWSICLALAVGVYAFRLVEFAIFEQWFSFSSVEVTSGFLGNKSLNIYWATAAIFLKFLAPFLLVLSIACRRLGERAIFRVSLGVVFLLVARLCHIALWFMLTARQAYASYHLVPELFFVAMFLLTYCLAAGLYLLLRRPSVAATPQGSLEVATA